MKLISKVMTLPKSRRLIENRLLKQSDSLNNPLVWLGPIYKSEMTCKNQSTAC